MHFYDISRSKSEEKRKYLLYKIIKSSVKLSDKLQSVDEEVDSLKCTTVYCTVYGEEVKEVKALEHT